MGHISLVTLAVDDLERATNFYETLGWQRSPGSVAGDVSFLEGGAVVLSLFGRRAFAADTGTPAATAQDPVGVALAMNVDDSDEVDEVLAGAESAGADVTQPARQTDWGGYAGCFRDPDGHLWEVAHNPHFELLADGSVVLPGG